MSTDRHGAPKIDWDSAFALSGGEQQYTVVHPGDHQPYHTDLHTATFLDALKRAQERTAYDAVFEDGRQRGRIVDGVAPQRDRTVERTPFERAIARAREPSVGD